MYIMLQFLAYLWMQLRLIRVVVVVVVVVVVDCECCVAKIEKEVPEVIDQ